MGTTRKTSRARPAKAAAATILLHETNERGDHRIVRVTDGKSQYGDWAANKAIARLDDLRAVTGVFAEDLPQGIFVTRTKEFISL